MAPKNHSLAAYFDARATTDNVCYANGYSTFKNESDYFYNQVVSEIMENMILKNPGSLLDIGCGTGEILSRIHKFIPEVQGVDISQEMITRARRYHLPVSHYNGHDLPFADSTFDAIIIYQVITNFPTLRTTKKLIEEANRVLKPGGCLFIGAVADPESSPCPQHTLSLRSLYSRLRSWLGGSQHIGYFSYNPDFFTKLARAMNFSNISFSRCQLQREGWKDKYHIIMSK